MAGEFDPYHRWLGIPSKDQPANHYRLLGIQQFESDPEVIRDAAEQRIAHVRTYQLGQFLALSQAILNELATAKACLLDPKAKAAYDGQLSKAPAPGDRVDELKGTPSSPPALPQAAPSSDTLASPATPRWLLPTAVGGSALLVVIAVVALVLTRDHGGERAGKDPEKSTPVGTGSGEADKKTPDERNPPTTKEITVSVDQNEVIVNEGEIAKNIVKCDFKDGNAVKIAASPGELTRDEKSHIWRWRYVPVGPGTPKVKITASVGEGTPATATFGLVVKNVPPTISTDHRKVTLDEWGGASNTGKYIHPKECAVELSASYGSVTPDYVSQTWSWSYRPSDGPLPTRVTIMADDGYDTATTDFELALRLEKPKTESKGGSAVRVEPGRLPPEGLKLPAGISPGNNPLRQEMLEAPKDWQARFFPDIDRRSLPLAYVVYHPNKLEAYSYYPLPPKPPVVRVVTCKWADSWASKKLRQGNGKLHGYAAQLDNRQQLQVLACYAKGQLHGQVKLWDEQGFQRYYGEYQAGTKHGLTCFFQKGALKLIRQYSFGQVRQCLVRWTADGIPSVAENLSPQEERERDKMVAELEDLESRVKSNEAGLREEVKADVLTAINNGGSPLVRPEPKNPDDLPGRRGAPRGRPVNPNPNNQAPNGTRSQPYH
jgi:hypothetical protein